MTLRRRLFILISATVTLTVVLVTWTVTASARSAFAAVDAQRTAALVAQFQREFKNEGRQVTVRLERLATSDAVMRMATELAIGKPDYAPFVNEARTLAVAQGLEFLDIVAGDGTIISSAQWPARFGYRHGWAIDSAKAGAPAGEFLQAVDLPQDTALGLVAVRRVTAGDATIYLAGGRRVDRELLNSLVLPAGMRALLYKNLQPELSRQQLIAASSDEPSTALLDPLIARVRQSGQEARETVAWPDGPESVDAIPLAGRRGQVLGVLLLGSSGRELAQLIRRILWSAAGFGVVGIALGFVVSYFVAARVTEPVETLANAAREIAGGRWDVTLEATHGSRELDTLTAAFDTMTRQLVDQRDRLVQAERVAAWRELARRLAHELKNPLFPLRITLDNLRRAKALPPTEFDEVFEEGVATMTTGLANLNTVIGRFSDFAKAPVPEIASVEPNTLVRESAALFKAQLEAPGAPPIRLALDLADALPTIRGDEEQLRRALQNLLLNAIDAMPEGGDLRLRTGSRHGAICIDVSDTGQGLTEEEKSRLFTPYYTTKVHGTGLGLAIVQAVVTDHRGKIRVDSEPGRGTTFHIELPS